MAEWVFPESKSARIRCLNSPDSLTVTLICAWDRGSMDGPVMSTSSGPKDYLKNDVWNLFVAHPQADRIVMVQGFLMRERETYCWFDVAGNQVVRADA